MNKSIFNITAYKTFAGYLLYTIQFENMKEEIRFHFNPLIDDETNFNALNTLLWKVADQTLTSFTGQFFFKGTNMLDVSFFVQDYNIMVFNHKDNNFLKNADHYTKQFVSYLANTDTTANIMLYEITMKETDKGIFLDTNIPGKKLKTKKVR